jgi:hypothetical protein
MDMSCAYMRACNNELDKIMKDEDGDAGYVDFAAGKDVIARSLGFDNHQECDRYMKPKVPRNVQLLCEYCEVFTNRETVYELVPMLYVYWG